MPDQIAPRLLQRERMRRCQLHECRAACCLYGVWMDQNEVEKIRSHAQLIIPHLPPGQQDPSLWWNGEEDDDAFTPSGKVLHSTVLDMPWHYGGTACVFLRSDFKCALQVASEAEGYHAWHFKPFYCVLHPLDLDQEGRITLDSSEALLDEPASCLRPSDDEIPLIETFAEELRYFLGEQAYEKIVKQESSNGHS